MSATDESVAYDNVLRAAERHMSELEAGGSAARTCGTCRHCHKAFVFDELPGALRKGLDGAYGICTSEPQAPFVADLSAEADEYDCWEE